jgi:tRNA nucleotidyltransferase/poly(A) polymerase
VDYAVEIESFDHMREMIHELKGEIFQEREEFGCIRANIPGLGPADFTLCRKDGFYADGRRPESIESGSILDDLARRDFTVNAIAVDAETGEVVDPHGGRADLETGVLRAVGDPMARMREDSLRALRAVRFAATKGLVIHPSLRPALSDPEVIESLKKLPSERVYNEIEAMFRGANTLAAMDLLSEYPELREVVFSKIGLKPSLEPAFYHP